MFVAYEEKLTDKQRELMLEFSDWTRLVQSDTQFYLEYFDINPYNTDALLEVKEAVLESLQLITCLDP